MYCNILLRAGRTLYPFAVVAWIRVRVKAHLQVGMHKPQLPLITHTLVDGHHHTTYNTHIVSSHLTPSALPQGKVAGRGFPRWGRYVHTDLPFYVARDEAPAPLVLHWRCKTKTGLANAAAIAYVKTRKMLPHNVIQLPCVQQVPTVTFRYTALQRIPTCLHAVG